MLKIKEYVKAESLEKAYELNQKKSNRIIGGMLWLKMSKARVQTAIDLSGLGLDTIEENEEAFSIGCMVPLRELELHQGLNELSCGCIRKSVKDIVGVQFRNLATIGGSIFGRFGFSDVLTCFLALDTSVELYHGGIVPLAEFVKMERDRDILVRVIVKKTPLRCAYLTHRNSKTDFPVLAVAVASGEQGAKIVVGARPKRAMEIRLDQELCERINGRELSEEECRNLAEKLAREIPTESNMRASAEYRTLLAGVLIRRGLMEIQEGGEQ